MRAILALVVLILALAANLVWKVDLRIALLLGGAALACLAGKPGVVWMKCRQTLQSPGVIWVVLPVLGYTQLLRDSRCHVDLVALLIGPITSVDVLAIPLVVVCTFVVTSSLLSANASAATVGVVAVPLLVGLGVPPVMAGTAVLVGTWGAVSSFASMHAANIANQAKTDPGKVVLHLLPAALFGLLVVTVVLYTEARLLGEVGGASAAPTAVACNPSPLKAVLPILPLALLLLKPAATGFAGRCLRWAGRPAWEKRLRSARLHHYVAPAMVLASLFAVTITGMNPAAAGLSFARGTFQGLLDVVGLMMAGMVLIGGLEANGVIDLLLGALRRHKSAAPACAMMTTLTSAALTGSSDAAVTGVVNTLTDKADQFKTNPLSLGGLAWVGGEMGRCLSPVAAVTATVAGANPWPVVGRSAIPILAGAAACFFLLCFRGQSAAGRVAPAPDETDNDSAKAFKAAGEPACVAACISLNPAVIQSD